MKPEAIRFIRKRKWGNIDSHIIDIPWDEIANTCFAAWQDIQDKTFTGNVLPDEKLRGRYFDLLGREDDATQDEWNAFDDTLRDHVAENFPDLKTALENVGTILKGRKIWYERDGSVPGVDDGITFDELRGASMLAGFRRQLERNMRVRGIEPEGEHAVKDAETVRQAGLNAITPSFFELFEDYIAEEDSQLAADGVELEARTAWMHEMYLTMLNTLKE